MANINEPSGSLVLRGHKIETGSDIGHAFAVDCCRFIENLISEEALRKKYGLITDASWRELEMVEPLQLLIGRIKEERIRDGTAQREKAALRWNSAIDVIDRIVQDETAPSRARLDGAKELRACAAGTEANTPASDKERFTITLVFGKAHTVNKVVDLKPIKSESDDEEYRPTGLLNYSVRRQEGEHDEPI
jgi:hypothetical protein